MKHFLYKTILFFVLPIVVCTSISEWALRRIPNDYSYKNNWLEENAKNVQILNLGSSHTYFGIEPTFFSFYAFNAAHVSQGLRYDDFIFKKFVNQMDSLKYIIVPISYFTPYSRGLEYGSESWRVKNYTLYYHCPYYKWYEIKYAWEFYDAKPRTIINALLGNENHLSCNEFGRGLGYAKVNRNSAWKESGAVAARRHTHPFNQYIFEQNRAYIDDMVSVCSAKGIQMILLTTPTYISYRENLDEEQLNNVYSFAQDIATQYDNVIYLNWLEREDFTEDDFFDADHLNEFGAKKLTILLDSAILDAHGAKVK